MSSTTVWIFLLSSFSISLLSLRKEWKVQKFGHYSIIIKKPNMFNFLYLVFSISSDNNNTSACYINMEVISNEHQPPRYAQVVQSSTTTTNLASPTTNLSISSRHEEPPPSYDTVIVQLARGLDGSCTTNIIRWWKKLSESCIIFVWSHMYFIYLQNIIIYLGSNILMYVLQYSCIVY